MTKYFIKIVLFMAIGLVITLFLHELSHLCVLILLNGQLADFSIGTQSFVSGYIDQTHIPTVALGSIVIVWPIGEQRILSRRRAWNRKLSIKRLHYLEKK